jgi:arabinogalactan endo-1,4-beta-galactosidase
MRTFAIRVAAFALWAGVAVGAAMPADALPITVQPVSDLAPGFMMGADMSMLDQLEHSGGRFFDQAGQPQDALRIVRDDGVNWIRLRLWHTPVNDSDVIEGGRTISHRGDPVGGGNNDLATTIRLATRSKALGLKVLLDIHYSDFWVDPEKQTKPAAWRKLSGAALEQAVQKYTHDVLEAMKAANVYPDMIQIGNELNGGMLWPDGKTWKSRPDEVIGGDDGFVALMNAGIRGVRETDPQAGTPAHVRVAVHLADGGNNELYRRVFDLFTRRGVDYDVIGLSFYPYYHGPIEDLRANADDISARYGKDVVVLETAYGYTTQDGDGWPNLFNADMQKSVGYKATVQGQASVVRDVIDAMAQVPGHRGIGVFYWEPDWIPAPRAGWRTGEGNAWDNQAMFDFKGKALPSLAVFKRVRETGTPEQVAANTPRVIDAGPLKLGAFAGEPWSPPEAVKLQFSDDAQRKVWVQWDDVPAGALAQVGHFALKGEGTGGIALVADVEVVPRRNLLNDGSFEKGDLADWTITGDTAAASNERNPGNAHSGIRSLHYWSGSHFRFEAVHAFADLKDGTYDLRAWAAGSGTEKTLQLFVRDCGDASGKTATITNTGWQKWKQYAVTGIKVSGGHCTVGVLVEGETGSWGNVDDIEFARRDAN